MIFLNFLLLFVLKEASGVIYRLNETEYSKLPPLYQLDDFYPCLQAPGDVYCRVDAALVANTTSELLNIIKEYSAQTITHYNHTLVHRGLCMTRRCRQYLSNFADLDEAIEGCLNATLYETHQLQVNLIKDKVRCTYYNEKIEIDAGDWVVAIVIALLLLLTVVGSVFDGDISGSKHIGSRLLLCFSLKRNWHRLTQPSGEGSEPRLERLKCISGMKTITAMIVIFGHAPIGVILNTNNPEFLESSFHNPMWSIIYGGMVVTLTFYIISGLLLIYNILLMEEKTKFGWKMLPKAVILRWLRLTPAYAVVLALTSTWVRHTGSGPFWKTDVVLEIDDCRRNWYYHLLYVNNYVDNSHCMTHSWYLAGDMQLSVLGLFLFCLATGARARKMAVGAAIVLGLLTPALHTYMQNLHPIVLMTPEVFRRYFAEDPTFNNLYKRGHTNIISYALGLGLGMLIYHLQEKTVDVAKYKKYRPLYWATPLLATLIIMTSGVFYIDGIQIPMALLMVYSSAVKTIFGLQMIVFLLGTIFKIETLYRPVMEWRGWAAPARVSYCAYLVHVIIVRTLLGDTTSLVKSSLYLMTINYLGIMTLSFLLAVPLWMVVESPCAQVVKVCLMSDSRSSNLEKNKSISLDTPVVVLGNKETIEIKQ